MQSNPNEKVYLADLVAKPVQAHVCVRVMRKWTFDGNKPGGQTLLIGLLLSDEKGDSMYGQITRDEIRTKGHLIDLDKVYTISRFTVRTAKTDYVPVQRQFMIEFTSFTKIKEVKEPPTTFPAYVYSLTPFTEIDPATSLRQFIDVLGIITTIGNPEPKALKTVDAISTMREITIKDLSDNELKVTLWGQHAANFTVEHLMIEQTIQSVVVLFVGCLPRIMNKKPQLTGGSGCHWYFNPSIKEAEPYYAGLKRTPVAIRQSQPDTGSTQAITEPKLVEYKSLDQLSREHPFKYPRQGYKCSVTVTSIPKDKQWSYIGCKSCKKSAHDAPSPFVCSDCNYKVAAPLYMFSFVGADDTGEAAFLAYNEQARMMIRRNVETLIRLHRDKPGLPKEITDVISKKFTLSLGLSKDSFQRMDMRTYIVKAILVDHQMQAAKETQLLSYSSPDQTSSSVSLPLTAPQGAIVQAQQTSALTSLTTTQADITQAQQAGASTSPLHTVIGDDPHTPPPTVDAHRELQDSTVEKTTQRPSLAPRKLFTDKTSDSQEEQASKDSVDAVGVMLPESSSLAKLTELELQATQTPVDPHHDLQSSKRSRKDGSVAQDPANIDLALSKKKKH